MSELFGGGELGHLGQRGRVCVLAAGSVGVLAVAAMLLDLKPELRTIR